MSQDNPYATPTAEVRDNFAEGTGEIKLFTPKGRMGRLRYFFYTLLAGIIAMVLLGIVITVFGALGVSPTIGGIIGLLIYIAVIIWSFFFLIQRCHDLNKSGWFSLISLIPFAIFYFYFAPGTKGSNQYGLQPPPNSKSIIAFSIILPILMVVLMGIISAIAVPAYSQYMERAQQAQGETATESAQ